MWRSIPANKIITAHSLSKDFIDRKVQILTNLLAIVLLSSGCFRCKLTICPLSQRSCLDRVRYVACERCLSDVVWIIFACRTLLLVVLDERCQGTDTFTVRPHCQHALILCYLMLALLNLLLGVIVQLIENVLKIFLHIFINVWLFVYYFKRVIGLLASIGFQFICVLIICIHTIASWLLSVWLWPRSWRAVLFFLWFGEFCLRLLLFSVSFRATCSALFWGRYRCCVIRTSFGVRSGFLLWRLSTSHSNIYIFTRFNLWSIVVNT